MHTKSLLESGTNEKGFVVSSSRGLAASRMRAKRSRWFTAPVPMSMPSMMMPKSAGAASVAERRSGQMAYEIAMPASAATIVGALRGMRESASAARMVPHLGSR